LFDETPFPFGRMLALGRPAATEATRTLSAYSVAACKLALNAGWLPDEVLAGRH